MSAGKLVLRRLPWLLSALYRSLASLAARRWVSLLLIALILSVDVALPWQGWSFAVRALLDEPCHQATGLICLGAITRFLGRPPDPRFGWAMLICSNAIDLDHVPLALGSSVLTAGTPRPYTHALWVVVVLGVSALVTRAWFQRSGTRASAAAPLMLFGAACGVSDHFLRDIATAQMSLWWPVTNASVEVSYWWYVAAIVAIALLPLSATRRLIHKAGPRSVAGNKMTVRNLPNCPQTYPKGGYATAILATLYRDLPLRHVAGEGLGRLLTEART